MARSGLLSRIRTEIRRRNYSYRTEKAYTKWVIRYVKFHNLEHPKNLAEDEVVQYLNYLAEERNIAASTQNQALCAILFMYDNVLNRPLENLKNLKRASKPKTSNGSYRR